MKKVFWIIFIAIVGLSLFWGMNETSNNVEVVHAKSLDADFKGPQRILCFTPSISETIFALGGGDRIAGVSTYVSYPPEALKKPKLGGHVNPNLERLLTLNPDLVIFQGQGDTIFSFCRDNKIKVMRVAFHNIESIFTDMRSIGKIISETNRAEQLCIDLQQALDEIKAKVSHLPRKKVFFTFDRTPGALGKIYTTNRESFISELITIAGGDNIFGDVKTIYPQISKETLMMRAPDVIIEMKTTEMFADSYTQKFIADWQVLTSIPAVQKNEIHILDDTALIVPGPRIVDACKIFAKILYPEVFIE